jgi:hypothetical protein
MADTDLLPLKQVAKLLGRTRIRIWQVRKALGGIKLNRDWWFRRDRVEQEYRERRILPGTGGDRRSNRFSKR